jgi:hypothetical protein
MGSHDWFDRDAWSLDLLPPPWGDRPSIYEHLRRNTSNGASKLASGGETLPDDDVVNTGQALRWVPGGWTAA